MGETLVCGVVASMGGGWELVQRLVDGADKRWRARNATGRKGPHLGEEGRDDRRIPLRDCRRPRNGWFGLTILAALVFLTISIASADDYQGKGHLKHDAWKQLNVLLTTLNERCVPEVVLGTLIERLFESARVTPVIAFGSEFQNAKRRFQNGRWHEHIQDELYLMVTMGCMPEVEDWGLVVGHVVYAGATFYAFDRHSGSHRSWGGPYHKFGDAGVLELGGVARDYLTIVVAEALDDYLEANLGSREAVVAYRGDYPREANITKMVGPIGSKASP